MCATEFPRDFPGFECSSCGTLLEISVDPPGHEPKQIRAIWKSRRCSEQSIDRSGVWRFREFLPSYPNGILVTLGEGNTPVIDARRSATYAGMAKVAFKHLGWNPTGSFKDLGMTVAVTEAVNRGAKVVACASTGNTAASMAAYAARAGITARVYLPAGRLSRAKVAQSIDYGAEIVDKEGNFDQALESMMQKNNREEYFLNSINPFRIEGQKTAMFELMEQLEWRSPDFLVVPGGNLGNSSAYGKGLKELYKAGLIENVPKLIIVQAEGANALVRTVAAGGTRLERIAQPDTCASAISIGSPKSWKKALDALKFTKGLALDVTDEEILDAKKIIGQDGIGCEPASATTLAGIKRLRQRGTIGHHDTVIAILTGHVLKDPDAVLKAAGTNVARGV